jgi:hypothetical protein
MGNTIKIGKILLCILFLALTNIYIIDCIDRHQESSGSGTSGSGTSGSGTSGSGTSGGGTSGSGTYHREPSVGTSVSFNIPGDPLEYKKFLINDRNDNLRQVYVEIYSKSDKPITINIREFVDPNLCIILPSIHGYILSTINEISLYKLGILESIELQDNISVSEKNNYLILKFSNYNISLNQSNMIELNGNEEFSSESYNIYNNIKMFSWNSCKDKNLTQFPHFASFLMNLGIINESEVNYTTFIKSGTCINLINNGSIIANISKVENKFLDRNSMILKIGNFSCHLKYSGIDDPAAMDSQMITINKATIPPGSIFAYWYYLKPLGNGNYRTDTISDSIIPGIIKPAYMTLTVENMPKFSVIPRISQLKIYLSDTLPIEYNLIYLGGGSRSISVPVEFQKSDKDYDYVRKNGEPDNIIKDNYTMSANKSVSIKKYLKFKHPGVQLPPGISVNGEYFATEKEISVDSRFSRDPLWFAQTSFLILTLILFIIGNIFLFDDEDKRKLKNRIEICRKQRIMKLIMIIAALVLIYISYKIYMWTFF